MSQLSERAEQIASHLAAHHTGANVEKYDTDGRQSVVDFMLAWRSGGSGALEVTMITEPESIAWQGLAMRDGWRWPARTSWEFRPTNASFRYQQTKRLAMRAIGLCDEWNVDEPTCLPEHVLADDGELAQFLSENVGRLKRTPFSPGVTVYQATTAEFVESASPDFALVVEGWLDRSHMVPHLQKLRDTPSVNARLLFLVVVSEALPVRFFADDFDAPVRAPRGYEGVDSLFVWSDYWHRYLACERGQWAWCALPTQ